MHPTPTTEGGPARLLALAAAAAASLVLGAQTAAAAGPATELEAVANLTAEADYETVVLTWDAPPWDNEIEIRRDGAALAVLPEGSTSYTDAAIEWGTEYAYTVAAVPEEGRTAAETTVTATTTWPPDEGECQGTVTVVADWGSSFLAHVTVANHGNGAITSWDLDWTWSGDQRVTALWGAEWSQSGATVTAGDLGWNGAIAIGDAAEFGFIATGPAEEHHFLPCEFV